MKTTFDLIEVKEETDKIRLHLMVGGGNDEVRLGREAWGISLQINGLDLHCDIVPMDILITMMEENGLQPNVLLVSALGCKDVMPLAGCMKPSSATGGPASMRGLLAPVLNTYDLRSCFSTSGGYTAYVDATVLEDGPAGWRFEQKDTPDGPKKYFTLTKIGKTAVLEIPS